MNPFSADLNLGGQETVSSLTLGVLYLTRYVYQASALFSFPFHHVLVELKVYITRHSRGIKDGGRIMEERDNKDVDGAVVEIVVMMMMMVEVMMI